MAKIVSTSCASRTALFLQRGRQGALSRADALLRHRRRFFARAPSRAGVRVKDCGNVSTRCVWSSPLLGPPSSSLESRLSCRAWRLLEGSVLRENICRFGVEGRVHRYGEIHPAEVRPPRERKKMVFRKVRNVLYCDRVRLTQDGRI